MSVSGSGVDSNENKPLPDWNHHPELPIKVSPLPDCRLILKTSCYGF